MQRRVAIIAEVPKAEKGEPSERLAERARILSKAGVQALSVKTDAYDTDLGLQDLFTVVRAVPNIPVLRRDWIIHPLQVRPLLLCVCVRVHACGCCACAGGGFQEGVHDCAVLPPPPGAQPAPCGVHSRPRRGMRAL